MLIKRIFPRLFLTAACAAAAFACVGCAADDRREPADKIEHGYSVCYAFTADTSVLALTETTTVKDYMDALKAAGRLDFEGNDGGYGYYITSVFGIKSRTVSSSPTHYAGYDWAVYTTLTQLDGVIYSSDEAFIYGGITLYKTVYGVSGIPCAEGRTYALVYEYYETGF